MIRGGSTRQGRKNLRNRARIEVKHRVCINASHNAQFRESPAFIYKEGAVHPLPILVNLCGPWRALVVLARNTNHCYHVAGAPQGVTTVINDLRWDDSSARRTASKSGLRDLSSRRDESLTSPPSSRSLAIEIPLPLSNSRSAIYASSY